MFIFFFSSRRRHTRWNCDWSSDVCSSDLGLLAFPAMLRAGYNKQFAAGAVTASGTLGILIPPSVLLILYGFVAGVSVPRLYAGAFLPGFMLATLYFGYIVLRAKLRPQDAPMLTKEQREQMTGPEKVRLILRG